MTEEPHKINSRTMPPTMAPLRNVAALASLVERVVNRSDTLPGMATFHGPSGYGKSTAVVYVGLKTDAICVQVKSVWSRKSLCTAIVKEMGIKPAPTIAEMVDQICEHLAAEAIPLIIDEADYLMKPHMIEVVRDIYEGCEMPVILIGEEQMPQKLRRWERVHNRMLDWVAAEPADFADTTHLARIYAPNVEVAPDLLKALQDASKGNTRRICVNLERVKEFAIERGLDRVDRAAWASRDFFTGDAPQPRYRAKIGGAA